MQPVMRFASADHDMPTRVCVCVCGGLVDQERKNRSIMDEKIEFGKWGFGFWEGWWMLQIKCVGLSPCEPAPDGTVRHPLSLALSLFFFPSLFVQM